MATIVKVMQLPDSGLEIRDRMWLKITISNAVIGKHVKGMLGKKEETKQWLFENRLKKLYEHFFLLSMTSYISLDSCDQLLSVTGSN